MKNPFKELLILLFFTACSSPGTTPEETGSSVTDSIEQIDTIYFTDPNPPYLVHDTIVKTWVKVQK